MCKFHAWTKIHFQVRRLMTLLFLAGAKLLSILIFLYAYEILCGVF